MASGTGWTWSWVNSGRWWWTGRPGVLRFMGSQKLGHDWATELTELNWTSSASFISFIWRFGKIEKWCDRCHSLPRIFIRELFNWSIITLQCCVSLYIQQNESAIYIHAYSLPFGLPSHSGHSCACSVSHVWIFATLQTVACQAPLSMGLSQARILEWVAISSCRGSAGIELTSPESSCISRWICYHRTTWEALLWSPQCSK